MFGEVNVTWNNEEHQALEERRRRRNGVNLGGYLPTGLAFMHIMQSIVQSICSGVTLGVGLLLMH